MYKIGAYGHWAAYSAIFNAHEYDFHVQYAELKCNLQCYKIENYLTSIYRAVPFTPKESESFVAG